MNIAALIEMGVIVESDRDRRTLEYLVKTCGAERVAKVCGELPGQTRPYVSNIAKRLGVVIPEEVVITPRAIGRERVAELKNILSSAKKR